MEEEYEIQHFGFSTTELKEETMDMIHCEVDKTCEILVANITASMPIETEVALEIDQKKNNLAKDIKELFKESSEKIGTLITEHFSIPPNVTLIADQCKLKSIDCSEEQLQLQLDDMLKNCLMFEQVISTLQDELKTYNNMESLHEIQTNAIELAEESISRQADFNYIKELAANVKKCKNQS